MHRPQPATDAMGAWLSGVMHRIIFQCIVALETAMDSRVDAERKYSRVDAKRKYSCCTWASSADRSYSRSYSRVWWIVSVRGHSVFMSPSGHVYRC